MRPEHGIWGALAALSLRDPRAGAEAVLRLNVPPQLAWLVIVLTGVLSTLIGQIVVLLRPEAGLNEGPIQLEPIALAVLQVILGVVLVTLIHHIGRLFGGRGDLAGALVIVAWFQLLMTGLQVLQAVVALALPPLMGTMGLVTIFLFFWWLTGFICALHGFASAGLVYAGVLAVTVALLLGLAAVLLALGMVPAMPGMEG